MISKESTLQKWSFLFENEAQRYLAGQRTVSLCVQRVNIQKQKGIIHQLKTKKWSWSKIFAENWGSRNAFSTLVKSKGSHYTIDMNINDVWSIDWSFQYMQFNLFLGWGRNSIR